jgi:multiple sugar transport system substrate-binding protein
MRRLIPAVVGAAAAVLLTLSACGSNPAPVPVAAPFPTGNVTITMSGWSLPTTPEFKTLTTGFHALHPNITINIKEYDPSQYDTLMTNDLAAHSAPDVIALKTFKQYYTYVDGGVLMDISDVAAKLPAGNSKSLYLLDGKSYGVPYRQDSWILYYNKDLFDKAGVAYPDGTWTWDDYVKAAKALTTGLKAAGSSATGTYEHLWQSTLQGFAQSQTPGADMLTGNFAYLKPYYDRALDLQSSGAQPNFGTVTTAKLTYQGEFGKQATAMLPMGSWYIATLLTQQKAGTADTFHWAIAPAPQFDSATTGTDKVPNTFGDPTGLAINANLTDGAKLAVAKAFLAYAAGPDGAKALAGIGITPAITSDAVVQAFFAQPGIPTDSLSKFAWSTHHTKPENPVSKYVAGIQDVLNALHTAVMSGSTGVDAAISQAEDKARTTVLNQ